MSSSPEKRKQTAMVGEGTNHNPSFVTKVPWYLGKVEENKDDKDASLDHQKNWKPAASSSLTASEQKSSTSTTSAQIDPSLVCENCGNKGHVRRDCLERPRKILAKYSEEEVVEEPQELPVAPPDQPTGFEAKRDRWEGFQPDDYTKVVNKYEREEVRRKITPLTEDDIAAKKNKFAADETVANLRMRNDTAKYLYNLDVNSAFYDPKSRSMRDDPRAGDEYKGDNFVRFSGDVAESMKMRQFAWESAQQDAGTRVHEIANPTESVMILKKTEKLGKEKISEQQRAILQKYGALNESSDSD